jgi:hypothetical protein
MTKSRLSASVDADLLAAAARAVAEGLAENVSAGIPRCVVADHDRRMGALADFVAAYESKHGVITDEDIGGGNAARNARATVVRAGALEAKERVSAPPRRWSIHRHRA